MDKFFLDSDSIPSSYSWNKGERVAVVVGVNGPANSLTLPMLHFAESDAEKLSTKLASQECCFTTPLLMIGEKANSDVIKATLLDLTDKLGKDDFLLFYFSGHGEPLTFEGDIQDTYLVTHDFSKKRIQQDENLGLSMRWLQRKLLRSGNVGRILVILDCCYAGSIGEAQSDTLLQELYQRLGKYLNVQFSNSSNSGGEVRLSLAACSPSQGAYEDKEKKCSVFTGLLIDALAGKAVDENGYVTIQNLDNYLKVNISQKQKPGLYGYNLAPQFVLSYCKEETLAKRQKRTELIRSGNLRYRHELRISQKSEFMRQFCPGARVEDFDLQKLQEFAKKQHDFELLPQESILQLCQALGLASEVGLPTNAAVLGFHRSPHRHIHSALIRVTAEQGIEGAYLQDDLQGPLDVQVNKAIAWVISNLRTVAEIEGAGKRQERCEIPELALRELITNAVLHRNYEAKVSIQIKITNKQIIINNPGKLHQAIIECDPPFSFEESSPTNPFLLQMLIAQRWAEGRGRGFRVVAEEFKKYKLPLPQINYLKNREIIQIIIERPEEVFFTYANPHLLSNLPAPTYHHYIHRSEPYEDIMMGLKERAPVVIVHSLGGMGKTCLVREIADRFLRQRHDDIEFDAIVWISDKDIRNDEPMGTTNLKSILDEIAHTLESPGYVLLSLNDEKRAVERLLRQKRVLLIVDNFESIGDPDVWYWLINLPEPSKAIITTRQYHKHFRRNSCDVELKEMTDEEAWKYVWTLLRFLKIDKKLADATILEPIIESTGKNPLLMGSALGLLKYEKSEIAEITQNIYDAKFDKFHYIFDRCWILLTPPARLLLLATTFFSNTFNSQALAFTAGVAPNEFEEAKELLRDFSLLQQISRSQFENNHYTVHPIVDAFARNKLRNLNELEYEMHYRWAIWFCRLAHEVGNCWQNLELLKKLDPEAATFPLVIKWLKDNGFFSEALQITKDISYYYFIRGLWEKSIVIEIWRMEAARQMNNPSEEARALARCVDILSKQGNFIVAKERIKLLSELLELGKLGDIALLDCHHALYLYWRRAEKDYSKAHQELQTALNIVHNRLDLEDLDKALYSELEKRLVNYRYGEAYMLYLKKAFSQARQLFEHTLINAHDIDYKRGIWNCRLRLAMLDIEEGQLEGVEKILNQCRDEVQSYNDPEIETHIQQVYAELYVKLGQKGEAIRVLAGLKERFERLGMLIGITETEQKLISLKTEL